MPNKYQIAAVAVSSVLAYRLATLPLRRKYVELARVLIEVGQENESLHEQMSYLINMLNERGVELDEFDLIVLTNVVRKEDV